jgi:hypothetical protein
MSDNKDKKAREAFDKLEEQPDKAPESTHEHEHGRTPEEVTAGATDPPSDGDAEPQERKQHTKDDKQGKKS